MAQAGIIEAQIHQLLRDRERGPEYFTTVYYHDGSWDFRRVVGENMMLRKELEELKAKCEGDEQVENPDSIGDEPLKMKQAIFRGEPPF